MSPRFLIRRCLGIACGIGVHLLFFYTVQRLFLFLRGPLDPQPGSLVWNTMLALQFAVPHSWLLLPETRRRLGRWISGEFYGLFFCAATCGSLLLTIGLWRTSDLLLWDLDGGWGRSVEACFYLSWAALFYSLHLTGLGYQTGFTPWWHWLRGRPLPRRGFEPRGAYRWLRHPIYLSFLGLIWFTPRMSLDHAVLTGIWTVYIFVGSHLKDERLAFYLGRGYREYQAAVPGYPGFPWGPLGRRRLPESDAAPTAAPPGRRRAA